MTTPNRHPDAPSPLEFFAMLAWLDGRPMLDLIEPYRQRIFMDALYTFEPSGRPRRNLVLTGRAAKNWKSADLILAAYYRLLLWPSVHGSECYVIANDEGQAADDLSLAKKLLDVNPALSEECELRAKAIVRRDGQGHLTILPAKDQVGLHGKSYLFLFLGIDEMHGWRDYGLMEALKLDPTRPDALMWIATYASVHHRPGIPLFDLTQAGKRGDDPRMLFSWYAADYTTDPEFQAEYVTPEQRANPSMSGWPDPSYLDQQRRRLPAHKYRRLHLNLPGSPEGAAFRAESVEACVVTGRRGQFAEPGTQYVAFVDMSGGSSDDAVLAIAHHDAERGKVVLDRLVTQTGRPPFSPRDAVRKFVAMLREYRVSRVVGDRYAGETFRADFREAEVEYEVSRLTKSELYEALEPKLNAGEIELLDLPPLHEQLLGIVMKPGGKIDHAAGEHDDLANAVAGAIYDASSGRYAPLEIWGGAEGLTVWGR